VRFDRTPDLREALLHLHARDKNLRKYRMVDVVPSCIGQVQTGFQIIVCCIRAKHRKSPAFCGLSSFPFGHCAPRFFFAFNDRGGDMASDPPLNIRECIHRQ
jgi:hypothetical protein